ncbi:MAG: DUF433 domain-containing protein [Chloroflexota bacterium]
MARSSAGALARAIYSPSEVASYLRAVAPDTGLVPGPAQVFGWVRRGLLAPAFRLAPEHAIVADFDDLVTGRAISLFRAAGIPLARIAEAESFFAGLYGVERPFAHRHFWMSGDDIFGTLDGRPIAGTRGGQLAMPFMAQPRHRVETRLVFDARSGRPTVWTPMAGIELRPAVQAGQPCVAGTAILTTSVARHVRSGASSELVAGRLGLAETDVEAALTWECALARRAARSGFLRPPTDRDSHAPCGA